MQGVGINKEDMQGVVTNEEDLSLSVPVSTQNVSTEANTCSSEILTFWYQTSTTQNHPVHPESNNVDINKTCPKESLFTSNYRENNTPSCLWLLQNSSIVNDLWRREIHITSLITCYFHVIACKLQKKQWCMHTNLYTYLDKYLATWTRKENCKMYVCIWILWPRQLTVKILWLIFLSCPWKLCSFNLWLVMKWFTRGERSRQLHNFGFSFIESYRHIKLRH